MKIVKGILYFIISLLMVCTVLVIVCAVNPNVTEAISGFLYPKQKKTVVAEIDTSRLEAISELLESDENKNTEQVSFEPVPSDYVAPGKSEIEVPREVSGKNGYQQIQDDMEQIDEEAAEMLQSQLDTGFTGDGLDFDAVFYPYYAMLGEKEKHIYRQIYANANEVNSAFSPVEDVTAEQLRNIFCAVYCDHPELFWLEPIYAGKFIGNGQCIEIDLKFNGAAQNLDYAKAEFNENANVIIAEAQNKTSDYEKEKLVHDVLIAWVTYDLGAEMNQSAYSALVNGQTVCAGYARAFQYLLQQLGIPCYYCIGYAGESHAWNIVSLDDGYYNVDTTWDDTDNGVYDYFNKSDEDFADSHIREELSVYLPACNGQAYRNLAQEDESNLRSLADVGFTEEQVLTSMYQYYDDCYRQFVQNGIGEYTIYNVLDGKELAMEWYENLMSDKFEQAYMNDAVLTMDAYAYEVELELEKLQGDRYLVIHKASIR